MGRTSARWAARSRLDQLRSQAVVPGGMRGKHPLLSRPGGCRAGHWEVPTPGHVSRGPRPGLHPAAHAVLGAFPRAPRGHQPPHRLSLGGQRGVTVAALRRVPPPTSPDASPGRDLPQSAPCTPGRSAGAPGVPSDTSSHLRGSEGVEAAPGAAGTRAPRCRRLPPRAATAPRLSPAGPARWYRSLEPKGRPPPPPLNQLPCSFRIFRIPLGSRVQILETGLKGFGDLKCPRLRSVLITGFEQESRLVGGQKDEGKGKRMLCCWLLKIILQHF